MSQASPASDRPVRRHRKTEVGVVTSDKMNKTRRVEIERLVPHPKYGKYSRFRTVCYAHDEQNTTQVGDVVEIMETRPLSKLKRWRITRVVRQGTQRGLTADENPAQYPDQPREPEPREN